VLGDLQPRSRILPVSNVSSVIIHLLPRPADQHKPAPRQAQGQQQNINQSSIFIKDESANPRNNGRNCFDWSPQRDAAKPQCSACHHRGYSRPASRSSPITRV
jgi:hypothetical protein